MAAKGIALVGLGKYNDAIDCFDRVIEIDPNHADAWNNKGQALKDLGNNSEAAFSKAKELGYNTEG